MVDVSCIWNGFGKVSYPFVRKTKTLILKEYKLKNTTFATGVDLTIKAIKEENEMFKNLRVSWRCVIVLKTW